MKFLKHYWIVLSIFLLVVLLVLIRTFSQNNFRYDAVKWAETSVPGSNIMAKDQIPALGDKVLLINLGNKPAAGEQPTENTLMMNPASILEKANLNLIRKNKGPVILFSDDNSVSARVWMVLSEMGMKNIYILEII